MVFLLGIAMRPGLLVLTVHNLKTAIALFKGHLAFETATFDLAGSSDADRHLGRSPGG